MSTGWNTIVSDAGVFTELLAKLGVKDAQLEELYAIDADSLRALAPVHAVIFLFKYGKVDRESASSNQPLDGTFDTAFQENGVFFANQTIQNACATQAVLNALLNKRLEIDVGEELANIALFVEGFDPEMAGDTISNSERIRTAHNSFTAPKFIDSDESKRPLVDERDNGVFHFITYLSINNCIYELDGLRQYPIKHDALESPEEFYDKLPQVLQRRIAKYAGEIRFSLLAITNDKLLQHEQTGDEFAMQQELLKRSAWRRDNQWRRHDYTRLTVELLRNASELLSDEEWNSRILQAKKKSMRQ